MTEPIDPYRPPDPDESRGAPIHEADDRDPLRRLRGSGGSDPLFPYGGRSDVIDHWREAVDRVRGRLSPRQTTGLAILLAVLIGGAGVWWWSGAGAGTGASANSSAPFTAGGTTIPFAVAGSSSTVPDPQIAPGETAIGAEIVVHAAGAVVSPGVYRLVASSRIGDLVAAAGGMLPEADIDRINLAQPLSDGVRVYVPRIGEQDPPAPAGVDSPGGAGVNPSGGATAGEPTSSPPDAEPIDLNSASLAELDELPGVGPATAQAIVSFRETNGPFSSVDALLEVRGIGPAKLEQIRPLVRT